MINNIISFIWIPILINISLNIYYETKKLTKTEKLDIPLDFNKKLKDGNRILGQSTTIGGFILVVILGLLLNFFIPNTDALLKSIIVYFAHALGSFIKRRMGKPRGSFVPIIDHADYTIVLSIIFVLLNKIDYHTAIGSIIFILITTPIITYTFWRIGLRDNKF